MVYVLCIVCVRFSAETVYCKSRAVNDPYTDSPGSNILLIAVNARLWSSTLAVFVLVATPGMQTPQLMHAHPGAMLGALPIWRYSSQAIMRTHDSSHSPYLSTQHHAVWDIQLLATLRTGR